MNKTLKACPEFSNFTFSVTSQMDSRQPNKGFSLSNLKGYLSGDIVVDDEEARLLERES